MSDIRGRLTRGKGKTVVVEVELDGKLKDPTVWPECLEKLKKLFEQYGSITIKEIKKK